MPTVVDVANMAGVSVATVSRVMQNSNRVSDEKRDRVLEAIKTLGYETNYSSNVTRMRRKTILVVSGNCQDEFIDSVHEAAAEYAYDVAVYYTAGHSVKVNGFIKKLLKNKAIAGVITFGLTTSSTEALEEINSSIPVVQCCDELLLTNSFVVASDDRAMARDAVLHLAGKGYKKIAFLGVGKIRPRFLYSEERFSGYKAALHELGFPLEENLVAQCDYSIDSIERALEQFLSAAVRPDAVFCVRDNTAMHLVNAMTRRGIKVPNEMAVISCGSVESAEQCWLPLSNITYSYYEIGMEALNLMHNRIIGRVTVGRRTDIRHQIIDRCTT